ncbi:MAG: hypothetical protein DRJ01_07690 [Bacteroidetes bacterium]|nr:MAG: hypothetical protein DRJ01_07690 [Bacteroidota bacterium]
MNIEKIKKYNQKLLATLGTILVLIAIVGLILITYVTISDISSSYRYNNQDDGILSDEKIEELQKENKRQQLISYEIPRLVDTLNLVYIIPVSHKTLNSAEFIDGEVLELLNTGGNYKIDSRYSKQYYGDFNNLLIYDYKSDNIEKLFVDRVNFENIQTEYFKDDILILFKAATKDTYKDGVVNQLDYKTLFLYSLKDRMLREIKLKNADVSQIEFVENSKDLLIKFGLDHNKDGEFDEYTEPSLIKKYDFKSGELQDIVNEKINKELQMKLEGTKK